MYKTIDDMWRQNPFLFIGPPIGSPDLGGRSGQQPLQGFVVLGGGDGVVLQAELGHGQLKCDL